ncbi:cell division ATP-binding protein FtsE [Algiphilus sp.]|uniref:cell division ATP-binding protein FtsE n=1 Tax=Algiphilus sp. TaxID=1872431 RepID=UPI003452B593|nr:cell division ATP-binding protein FtsE [Algiphilus sp.]
MITAEQLRHSYPGSGEVLAGIDLTLARGEMAFLTGPSGAGKSTLLKLIACLERPRSGQLRVGGVDVRRLPRRRVAAFRQRIGIVFQNYSLLTDRRVFENVALPLVIRGLHPRDIARRVRAALDAVDLLGHERAYPLTLSGGEQQRVAIARAIVAKPELLLADEPTGNLDPALSAEIMALFRRFNEVGVSVLIASHALDLVRRLPVREIALADGRLEDVA